MSKRLQGAQANRTGKTLEEFVVGVFKSHGFEIINYPTYIKREGDPSFTHGEWLVRRAPYTTIYGHAGKTEFLVVSKDQQMVFRIECKWQQSSGSVDEKFPYVIENCKVMQEHMIIILVDGGACKAGALAWLKQAAEKCKKENSKDIRVFNMTEFMKWANDTF